jgi:hypothetical protein
MDDQTPQARAKVTDGLRRRQSWPSRRHVYNLEDIAANIRPWNLFGSDLKKKNRDHSDSITTTFRGVPVCFAEGNLGAM